MAKGEWLLITDGGCLNNGYEDAVGAWAFYLSGPKNFARSSLLTQVHGLHVTNNKAEFVAAISGLSLVPEGDSVELLTDSMILVNWINRFNKGSWNNRSSMDKNLLLELRDLVVARTVKPTWVKGHSGHPGNEWCDRQCSELLSPYDYLNEKSDSIAVKNSTSFSA